MSTATSPAPSTPFPPRQFKQVDPEPDKAWKDNLYKTIEETLQSMVDDAKKAYEERLAAAGSEAARGLAEEEYHKNMNNIRNLAKESFQAELNRERQERMATIKEAQAILETKRRDSVNQKAWHESRKQAAAAVVVEKPQPPVVGAYSHESSSFPPRNGPASIPATIPIAPTRPNDEHSDSHSPRGLDIRNFDYPRPAPPRSQPEPSPPKRRSTSSEVHSIPSPALPSSMTKSPMPPSSPFTSGAPFRPQDPSPTLGIAPINVVARDLPPELAARRDQYSSLSRRGSNAASQAREGYPRPSIPSFSSPKVDKPPQPPPSTDDHVTTDPEDESTSPMSSRWNPRRTSGSQDRGVDLPSSRSVERPAAYSPSERIPARPPSNPQLWQPSMSPAEDTIPPRTGSGLARRGSTASIRSTGSGSIRPNIAEPIPEHEGESGEREKEPTEPTEPRRRRESEQSKPPDPPVSTYAPSSTARPDSWTTSESSTLHDELASFSPPKPPSVTRVQDIMGPPATPPTRPPSTRKPSFQAEDRDHYQSQRLRNQTSFDDRAPFPPSSYTPAPPASRPSPRPGADFYEYPRPRDYYPPYSAPLPVDSPYGGEQRSNTWRRATQPESPPTRRPSENPRPTLNRDPSYGTKYARPADDDSPVYDDHRYFEYPPVKYDKYDSHPTSAIPIRQRNPSYNDDINGNGWKSGTWAEPIVRPRTRGPRPDFDDYPTRGGYDYDRERDRDYRPRDDHWGRDDREYDRDEPRNGGYDRDRTGYHTSRYSSEMVHSNSRDSYGLARSSPSSYRNENHHRFGGREYRPSWDDEEEDDYLDNPYSREYSDSTRYSRDYHRVRGSNFEREAAEVRTELFKDIRRQHGKPRYLDPPSTGESSLSDDDADDERPRVVSFVREKVPTRQKSLKMARKRSQSQGPSKEELEAAEQRRKEEEEKKRQEEAARREEEIEKKAMELMAEMQRSQEEERRRIEEARLKEEEELKKAEEEKRKREEIETKRRERDQRKKAEKEAATKRREEERRKKEEDERRRQEEEERERLEEERQRLEDERKREEEEERWRKEEQFRKEREAVRRKEEEIRRKEEEAKKKEEEWRKREQLAREEARRKEEELRRKEQEAKRKEEEARKKEEEWRRKEEESKKKEEEARRKEEEWKRKEQETKKKEQEARKKERELKKKEEETKRKEIELKRKEEEAKRKEEEARRREEELELERKRVEEEREEARRKEEEAQRREDELRRREEELQRRETEIAARRQQQQAEFRKREEEIRRRRGDAYDPDAGWAPSSYGSASSFGGRSYKKEDEIRLAAEEARRREKEEEDARREEEAKQEEARREEEAKKEEEERLRREQEESDRKAAEKLQEELMAEDREEEERRFKDAQQRDTERRKMDEIWRQKQTEQAKRKQQEEYRRQEEQIRQQAEERKRQRSGTHEFTNGSSSYFPPSSSPPSWTGQSNAWGSSQPSFHSAPRTSTTSANVYSSSFEQKDDGAHDWQRRQEEMFKKQQEQFRKEQERLDSIRQARDAGRPLSKNDILAIYDNHDRLWATMGSKSELRWKDFPWPMFKSPASPEEITMQTVSAYMQSPHYPETMKVKTYKDRLRDHIRRWHPDRFETQTLPRVVEDQKETVREAAGSVVRVLNDLNSRANNVHDVFS